MCNKICSMCGTEMIQKPNESKKYWQTKKFCSRECQFKSQIGKSINKGNKLSEEVRVRISENKKELYSNKENHPRWKEKTIKDCEYCGKQMQLAPWESERRFCCNKCRTDSSNKGLTLEHERVRKSKAYKDWRTEVFKRDDYTCQLCGKKGGILNADHIKSFAQFPELRLDIDNGRTLCECCHKKTDNFGVKGHLTKSELICGL